VDKISLGQAPPCQYHSTKASFSYLSSGDGTKGPLVPSLGKEVSVGSPQLIPSVRVQKIARLSQFYLSNDICTPTESTKQLSQHGPRIKKGLNSVVILQLTAHGSASGHGLGNFN
jgi:hypothetical protein